MIKRKAHKTAKLLATKTGVTHYVTLVGSKHKVISEKTYYRRGDRSLVIAAYDKIDR